MNRTSEQQDRLDHWYDQVETILEREGLMPTRFNGVLPTGARRIDGDPEDDEWDIEELAVQFKVHPDPGHVLTEIRDRQHAKRDRAAKEQMPFWG